MEEDIRTYESSSLSQTKTTGRVNKRLEEAIEKASNRLKFESAHDEELVYALSVVGEFIKRKKRVCYGGTAMNAILPKAKQFYDPQVDLPDYDFYTPDVDTDVEELVQDLNKAGFKDVYHKVGIHAGTKKILVNFVAVADVSSIEEDLFNVLLKRSILKDGMYYTDENILRMMMYLELSRPKGMVDRWKKVFERLQLINELFPIRACGAGAATKKPATIPLEARKAILDYIIEWQRILCNGPVISLYTQGIRRGNAKFHIQEGGPLLFTSPDPRIDALTLKKQLRNEGITLFRHVARGEIVPERIELRKDDLTLCVIVQETACHSYVTVPLSDGRSIYIGSLEFLITLYLSLSIFTTHVDDILGGRVLCQVKRFIELSNENYTAKSSQFPPFPLQCRGHQVQFASLLRQKVGRIQKEKEKGEKTTKRTSRSTKTRKRKQD